MPEPKPRYVEFHVLRSYPPSNLNRDDLGSPKSIVFGGVRRVRVSSQCLKRTWRRSDIFRDLFETADLGTRTARLPSLVEAGLPGDFPAKARDGLDQLFAALGKKSKAEAKADTKGTGEDDEGGGGAPGADEEPDETAHLLFISKGEIDAVAKFAINKKDALTQLGESLQTESAKKKQEAEARKAAKAEGEQGANSPRSGRKPKSEATKKLADLREALGQFLKETVDRSAVDVALFGRFLTSQEFGECNAALQVAHALGTQKLDLEYDYFSAVDDLQPEGETGAGHIGEAELCASVLYEYAVCDLRLLEENLAGDSKLAAKAMGAIAKAMCRSIFEKAKRNGTAPHTPADYLEVVLRCDAPVSLANAFLKPVRPDSKMDVMEGSIAKLREQAAKYDEAYGTEHVKGHFRLCLRDIDGVEKTHRSLDELAKALEKELIEAEPGS